jgi:hypothetical protein
MIATPTLQERVSAVEETVRGLVTSLPLPGAYARSMHKDIGRVKQETAAARVGILDLGVEVSEIQTTLRECTTTLDRHGEDLTDITAALDEHGAMLKEQGAMLRELTTTLGAVASRLGER